MTRRLERWGAAAALIAMIGILAPPTGALAAASKARVVAGATAAMLDERDLSHSDMTEAEMQGAGCLISGTAGTIAAYITDANEVVMVVAGGVFAPSTPTLLGIVMLSTVFTSGCAVGAIATPFLNWSYRQWWPGASAVATAPVAETPNAVIKAPPTVSAPTTAPPR